MTYEIENIPAPPFFPRGIEGRIAKAIYEMVISDATDATDAGLNYRLKDIAAATYRARPGEIDKAMRNNIKKNIKGALRILRDPKYFKEPRYSGFRGYPVSNEFFTKDYIAGRESFAESPPTIDEALKHCICQFKAIGGVHIAIGPNDSIEIAFGRVQGKNGSCKADIANARNAYLGEAGLISEEMAVFNIERNMTFALGRTPRVKDCPLLEHSLDFIDKNNLWTKYGVKRNVD